MRGGLSPSSTKTGNWVPEKNYKMLVFPTAYAGDFHLTVLSSETLNFSYWTLGVAPGQLLEFYWGTKRTGTAVLAPGILKCLFPKDTGITKKVFQV